MSAQHHTISQGVSNAPEAGGEDFAVRSSGMFFGGVAGLYASLSLVLLLAASDDTLLENERLLRGMDVLLGFSTRTVLIVAAAVHLILAGLLFVVRDTTSRVLLILWGCSVCAIYRVGIGWLKPATAPVTTLVAAKLGVNPNVWGFCWGGLLSAIAIGALLLQMEVARRRKRRADAQFLKEWRHSREKSGPALRS